MGAAEELAANLDSVANYSALAMLTNRRNRLNRALKAVKCVPRTGGNQFEGLVIFAFCHLPPHEPARQLPTRSSLKLSNQPFITVKSSPAPASTSFPVAATITSSISSSALHFRTSFVHVERAATYLRAI